MNSQDRLEQTLDGLTGIVESVEQSGFDFPQPLTDKYAPSEIGEFVGLDKVKNAMTRLTSKPFKSSWWFEGNSGTGKTRMAFAVGKALPAEVHHIPARQCTLDEVERVFAKCQYHAHNPQDLREAYDWHLIIVDEADLMSQPAQDAFLSFLDNSRPTGNTIVIFTANGHESMHDRFMSRVRPLPFSSYGISSAVVELLQRVWLRETSNPIETPNFARIVKENNNNVRGALMALETEIMCA